MIVSVAELMPRKLPAGHDLASPQHVRAIGFDPIPAAAAVDPVATAVDRVDDVVAGAAAHDVRPGAARHHGTRGDLSGRPAGP